MGTCCLACGRIYTVGGVDQDGKPMLTACLQSAAQADTKQKAVVIEKLQELCRKLQAQNKEMKEEDILKRKQLINSFQNTLDDIKSR